MLISRRQVYQLLGITGFLGSIFSSFPVKGMGENTLKPRRLKLGDTLGLINPAGFSYPQEIEPILLTIKKCGFHYKLGQHIYDQYGYLGGKDEDRARDVNEMFADDSVQAILAIQGGWGCQRILPLLDYELMNKNPKIIMGFSDITSLLIAIYSQSHLVTFHGPVGISSWTPFTLDHSQEILMKSSSPLLRNLPQIPVETIYPGVVQGQLLGGNLSVLAAMMGSIYLPDWRGKILFIEEINEEIYRVDRLLTQLKLAGVLAKISGFIWGQCRQCTAENPSESLTLKQVLEDHILPLKIPAWSGSMIGHMDNMFTLPLGISVKIDASLGTIQLLESAVI